LGPLEGPTDEQKSEVLGWISEVLGDPEVAKGPIETVLRNGVVICNLMNKLSPKSVKRIQKKGTKFTFMENIEAFQKAAFNYGLPTEDSFMPTDLVEARNMAAVVKSLYALARTAKNKGYAGPTMGPKMAVADKKEWTEDQLREGRQGHLGLQMGSNEGASQAGISMGKQRMILD